MIRNLLGKAFSQGLAYNMSWEDPEVDRISLRIEPTDTVLTLTSGGCNTLNLLLHNPRKVISIDANPVQTSLLELKCATVRRGDAELLWNLFGSGDPSQAELIYRSDLRQDLSPTAQEFWDRHIHWIRKGIYRYGQLGLFFRILQKYFQWVWEPAFFEYGYSITDLDEQLEFYDTVLAPRMWRWPLSLLLKTPLFTRLGGVHPEQQRLINAQGGFENYLKERVRAAFAHCLVRDGYFFSIAVQGRFNTRSAVPPYLKPENFTLLQSNLDRLQIERGSIKKFLLAQPASSINKFSLLDIFDWMDAKEMTETFKAVFRTASPGARIIYRSARPDLTIPEAIGTYFLEEAELATSLHPVDRSATYSGLYIYHIPSQEMAAIAAN